MLSEPLFLPFTSDTKSFMLTKTWFELRTTHHITSPMVNLNLALMLHYFNFFFLINIVSNRFGFRNFKFCEFTIWEILRFLPVNYSNNPRAINESKVELLDVSNRSFIGISWKTPDKFYIYIMNQLLSVLGIISQWVGRFKAKLLGVLFRLLINSKFILPAEETTKIKLLIRNVSDLLNNTN